MSELHSRWKVGASLLALLAAAALGDESAFAARLLTAEVEVDGKLVLRTSYADDGTANRSAVWRYLGREPGMAETAKIQPDEANPDRARLTGNIAIRIHHGGGSVVLAKATELQLVRIGSPNDRWYLPADEVERIAAANGIPRNAPMGAPAATFWLAIVALLAVLVLALVLLAWVMWPRSRAALADRG
jgi:hypothetical protein